MVANIAGDVKIIVAVLEMMMVLIGTEIISIIATTDRCLIVMVMMMIMLVMIVLMMITI